MSNELAIDTKGLAALRGRASADPKAAVKEAAKQFEALFMQEVMKRMRAASLESGLTDNEMSKLGTEMLDQQFASKMAGLSGGLSAAIERQLSGGLSGRPAVAEAEPLPQLAKKNVPEKAARFLQRHDDAAKAVSAETGIPASFMLAQAAHETGWGGGRIKMKDGSDSNNLFGIKAGPGWTGKVAEITTTEYIDGVARKVTAKFRAYDSPEESFRDYARLLTSNRRYAQAVDAAQSTTGLAKGSGQQFANALQKAGYATDPEYANKLSRVINTTLRLQRALV